MQRSDTERELADDAAIVVEKWNADLELRRQDRFGFADRKHLPQFTPHIGAALRAGKPWLRLYCPACQQFGDLDLRKVVRCSDTPLYDAMVCTLGGCRGRGDNPLRFQSAFSLRHTMHWRRTSARARSVEAR